MCDPILVSLLKMRPHCSQSSRENATPSSGTSPLAYYKEVPPGGLSDSGEVSSRYIVVFALSQFSGPDYLGAWNRLK